MVLGVSFSIEGEDLVIVRIDAVAQLLIINRIPSHILCGQGEAKAAASILVTIVLPANCNGVGRNGRNSMEHLALRVELNCNKYQ